MKKFTCLLLSILIISFMLKAQDGSLPPVTQTIAITNVNIIPSPGQLIVNGTVVMEKGVITAVGKNVAVPPGARIIKADSMYLYSGFIAGMSHAGVKMPEKEEGEKPKVPGNPPDEMAGISPERKVISFLSPQNPSLKELREMGFTIAQTAPEGGMLPGYASLILLNGQSADELIIAPQTALYATLDGSRGMYPATILGVMAKYRQLYHQAEQAQKFRQQYVNTPMGMQRPAYDRTLEAFYPVIDKKIPIAFSAGNVLEAQRVLNLQEELGFNILLTNLKEGWDIADKIKKYDAKVLFSLDLPEWKEDEKDSTKDQSESIKNAEKLKLEGRKEDFLRKYYGQMAQYQSAGIPFGFSTIGAEAKDIHGNLVRVVENGLSADAALAALTTTPATILGISKMAGTVENGKIANLVITTEPYFTKEAKVKYVVIDGELFENDLADDKKGDSGSSSQVVGSWSYTTELSEGTVTGTLTIKSIDGVLSGSITNSRNNKTSALNDVIFSRNNLSFSFKIEAGGETIEVEGVVTIEGETFKGTLSGAGEAFPVEGTRNPEK